LAHLNGRTYAFIGLERIGGVFVYDVTNPAAAELVTYANSRHFDETPGPGSGGDLSPEGLLVIPAETSPTGTPLLVMSHEVSGTVAIFEIRNEFTARSNSDKTAARVTIAPNPATTLVRIFTKETLNQATLLDAQGRAVRQTTNPVLDVADLPAGLYLLRVETTGGVTTEKIVKQ